MAAANTGRPVQLTQVNVSQARDVSTTAHTRIVSHSATSGHSSTPVYSAGSSSQPSSATLGRQSYTTASSSQAVVPRKPPTNASETSSQVSSQQRLAILFLFSCASCNI